MFEIIFCRLAEQMPLLKEYGIGQDKAIFIQHLLFSNCTHSELHKLYFQGEDFTFLGKVCAQNGRGTGRG